MIKMSNSIIQKINPGTQACAACKFQRRKCASDCILAPYFPQSRQDQFINAHKLFGVSNITKIIRHLDQHLKDEAMRTIIFQSNARANDPVGGCYRIIQELQRHIDYYSAELDLVYHHLALYRAQEEQDRVQVQSNIQAEPEDQNTESQPQPQQHQILLQDNENYTSNDEEISHHHSYDKNNYQKYDPNNNNNVTQNNQVLVEEFSSYGGMQESGFSSVPFLQQHCVVNEGDDIRPLLDLPIDRVEFRFDLDQMTEPRFGLEDEEESKL